MKILKYVLYGIGALIIIFLAFGLLNPSIDYGHEITVDKSIQEAWAVSQDESKYADWLDGFKSIDLISGEHNKVGAKYKVVVQPGEGQPEFEMTETIVSMKDFDHVEMHFDSESIDFEQRITFSEADGKTNIKSDSNVKGKGLITRSMFAMMEILGGSFTAQEARNFDALRKLIEENTRDYFPKPEEVAEESTSSNEVEK